MWEYQGLIEQFVSTYAFLIHLFYNQRNNMKPLIWLSMFYHGVYNSQETKYVVKPMKDTLRDGMRNIFERMCNVYESITYMLHFLIYTIMYIIL